MAASRHRGQAIKPGYPWRQRITITGPDGAPGPAIFPAGCVLRAIVREARSEPVLFQLTSGAGITRVSDTEIDLEIAPDQASLLTPGTLASIGFARTDQNPATALGFSLLVPVRSL